MCEAISWLLKNISAVFRHLVPGVLVMTAARITHESWFIWMHEVHGLWIAVAVTVAVGATWSTVVRYVFHQLVDWWCWDRGWGLPARTAGTSYHRALPAFVARAIRDKNIPERALEHVRFRASSVLLTRPACC